MNNEEITIRLLKRILEGDFAPLTQEEMPTKDDGELIRLSKEIANKGIEASDFIAALSSGNLTISGPRSNAFLGTAKELQSVLRHLLWQVECISKGDYNQRVEFLGDFSKYFNLFVEQVELREKQKDENAALEQKNLSERNQLLDNMLTQQLEHYKNLNIANKKVRAIKHDIKNHCFTLNQLLKAKDIEGAQDYILTISEEIIGDSAKVYNTGNAVFDAMVTEKENKAKELGIETEIQVMIKEEVGVSNLDWCVILGNTFDNAIEACERIEDSEKKIWLDVKSRGEMLNISMKNTAKPPEEKPEGLYQTSKENAENHGIGLSNVKNTVKKYDGILQTKYEEPYFMLAIMLCEV